MELKKNRLTSRSKMEEFSKERQKQKNQNQRRMVIIAG